jgi:hypothetical protein
LLTVGISNSQAPAIWTKVAIHCNILWLDCAYSLLFDRCKYTLFFSFTSLLALSLARLVMAAPAPPLHTARKTLGPWIVAANAFGETDGHTPLRASSARFKGNLSRPSFGRFRYKPKCLHLLLQVLSPKPPLASVESKGFRSSFFSLLHCSPRAPPPPPTEF